MPPVLRYLTAGESHGKAIVAILDGFPAGVPVDVAAVDAELKRRQGGYGRGARQKIEEDHVEILSGVWRGVTIGSPIALMVPNRDYKLERLEDLSRPRPGHADLSGALKYGQGIRPVLERASARETVGRVAVGALCKQLLERFGITCLGYVLELGGIRAEPVPGSPADWKKLRDSSPLYTLNPEADPKLVELIDRTREEGDTLGGVVEVRVWGLPFGLGSHTQWDRKLRGRIAQGILSTQAFWGVEFGLGFAAASRKGSQVHDPIHFDPHKLEEPCLGFVRPTNHAGGIEGSMTNAQVLVVRAAKKPISTLRTPLASVDLNTLEPAKASYERSDVCAVPAASVILENVVAYHVAEAFLEKFGADHLDQIRAAYDHFHQQWRRKLRDRLTAPSAGVESQQPGAEEQRPNADPE
jgi:chorismate synthase